MDLKLSFKNKMMGNHIGVDNSQEVWFILQSKVSGKSREKYKQIHVCNHSFDHTLMN